LSSSERARTYVGINWLHKLLPPAPFAVEAGDIVNERDKTYDHEKLNDNALEL
jgi:hypothetical protein